MPKRVREVKDIGRFIHAQRRKANVEDFPDLPRRRRHVPYLTQDELAALLDVSTVVISQIEQGRYPNLNAPMLHRISATLRLTQQQSNYLRGLLTSRPDHQRSLEPAPDWVAASVKHIEHPVIVVNPAYDLLSVNDKARAFFGDVSLALSTTGNAAASIFQIPAMREFIEEWAAYAASLVSGLRMQYAMFPEYRDYIDDLALRLEEADEMFRDLWNQPDPLVKPTIEKTIDHSMLGRLNILQILTDIVEAPTLTKIEFIAADEETRKKFSRM